MEYVKFIVTIIIILVIFYIAETQRRSQEKETKKMQSEIKKDDKIITYAGLTGIVDEVLEDRVILKVNPTMQKVSIEKWAIAGLDTRKWEDDKEEINKDKNEPKNK
jgi:preprotein translocase YajC subunit